MPLRDRIAAQFSDRGQRADVWRAFDLVLPTDRYLNLGYAPWYLPYPVAASQRRLAARVGRAVATHRPAGGGRLLDVGCGRGGPTIDLADQLACRTVGLDLVPYNLRLARANAAGRGAAPSFLAADATRLPFAPDSFAAATAIDSLVYLPDRRAALSAIAEVLEPGGVIAVADLFVRDGLPDARRDVVRAFADAWDMPLPGTVGDYEAALSDAGFSLVDREDITADSVGRFRRWTRLFCWLVGSPAGSLIERLLRSRDLDAETVVRQIEVAHRVLPELRHEILVARR